MDRSSFYASLRARNSGAFGTSLSQKQVNGCEAILDAAERRGIPLRQLAYILATVYHETAHTMQPIAEYGKGKGRKYGVPAGPYGHVYYGRGLVQLTWLANYERASKELAINLVKYPDDAMQLDVATEILITGMLKGWFTGKKLPDYISGEKVDYTNARRIVNGTDKAALIAGYAKAFETALNTAGYYGALVPNAFTGTQTISRPAEPVPALVVAPEPAKPPTHPVAAPEAPVGLLASLVSILASLFGRKAS